MLLHTLSRTLHTLFTHCGLFWPIFFQFQHVRCLIACIQAEKFNGDTFIQFLTLLDTLSHLFTHSIHTFHTLIFYFGHFFQFLHVGCLKASTQLVKFNGDTLKYFHTLFHTLHTIFTHFGLLWQNYVPISTCWVCKSMYSSWAIQW